MNVIFAHNVHDRYNTLYETIAIEKQYFNDSKIIVAHNTELINTCSRINNIEFIKFDQKEHKIGCVNGLILSAKKSLEYDYDVLIFSHDDVRINPNHINIVMNNINDIKNGTFDIICRSPESEWGDNYYMMEVIYMSRSAVVEIFQNREIILNENEIPKDVKNSISPEVYLNNIFKISKSNINNVKYQHTLVDYNETLGKLMGYHHLNAGVRGWR